MAPLAIGCSSGVSTSMNPALPQEGPNRCVRLGPGFHCSQRGWVDVQIEIRWRYRDSTSVMPCHFSGHGRRQGARTVVDSTLMESSPRRVMTTSPAAPTMSPTLSEERSQTLVTQYLMLGEQLHVTGCILQIGESDFPGARAGS